MWRFLSSPYLPPRKKEVGKKTGKKRGREKKAALLLPRGKEKKKGEKKKKERKRREKWSAYFIVCLQAKGGKRERNGGRDATGRCRTSILAWKRGEKEKKGKEGGEKGSGIGIFAVFPETSGEEGRGRPQRKKKKKKRKRGRGGGRKGSTLSDVNLRRGREKKR